jgi:hypothetical protein
MSTLVWLADHRLRPLDRLLNKEILPCNADTSCNATLVPFAWACARRMAHHGWSSFDQDRPIYLEGRVTQVPKWQNPHAELELEVPAGLKVPADLAQRPLPAQTAPVDGKACWPRPWCPRARTASGKSSWRR